MRLRILKAVLLCQLLLACPLWAGRSFNGSSDIITMNGNGTALDIASGPETISFWMYPTVVPSSGEHDALGHGTSQTNGVQFEVGWGAYGGSAAAANELGYVFGCCGAFGPSYGGCGSSYVANQWYHVVIYVDTAGVIAGSPTSGMLVSGPVSCHTDTSFSETRQASKGNFIVGKGWSGSNFQGYIAEVAVWNVLLTKQFGFPSQAMAALHTICPAGPSARRMGFPAPVAYYPLWGASGSSTEPDLGGNVLTGTLTGTSPANHAPCTP